VRGKNAALHLFIGAVNCDRVKPLNQALCEGITDFYSEKRYNAHLFYV